MDGSLFGEPGDKVPSNGGHGTEHILEVIKILEGVDITCCVVGISALKYFGAGRIRNDWEICVPTGMVDKAAAILRAGPHDEIYEPRDPLPPYPGSLLHTFPRFKVKGFSLWFVVIPSQDCHLDCDHSKFEWSHMGIPYPKLEVSAQSLLDTHDDVALTDLVDGMDLSEEWGLTHLDLSGTNDVAWAERKNEKIRGSIPSTDYSFLLEVTEVAFDAKKTWDTLVRTKERRLGEEYPKEGFATRFRGHNDVDPRELKLLHV